MNLNLPKLDKKAIITARNRAAGRYQQAAFVQREIADRLLDRLEIMQIQPRLIVDIGEGMGYSSKLLAQRYPDAHILAVDWAENLLRSNSLTTKIAAEPERLPLAAQSADLIVAHLVCHWLDDPALCLQEWRRVLKPGGLLLFTTLGPDTLLEFRDSFATADYQPRVHSFMDMHNLGDLLIKACFAEPVMQAEHLYFTYPTLTALLNDLQNTGAVNALVIRRRGLQGKNQWQAMLAHYTNFLTPEGEFPATMEVIYGLGWVANHATNDRNSHGEVLISVDQIRRSV